MAFGKIKVDIIESTTEELTLPTSVGTDGQVLTTDGNGVLSFEDNATGTDLTATADGTSLTVESSSGNNVQLPAATTSAWGVMSDEDKAKLNAIETSATADQTDAEIRTAVGAATDSNVFTDADHTKLDGVAANSNNYAISADLLDEDDFATDSATKAASQQSIKAYVDIEVAGLINSAPSSLDTLNELASALGDDSNYAATITTSLGLKAPLASPAFTGDATFAGNIQTGGNPSSGANTGIKATPTADLIITGSSLTMYDQGNPTAKAIIYASTGAATFAGDLEVNTATGNTGHTTPILQGGNGAGSFRSVLYPDGSLALGGSGTYSTNAILLNGSDGAATFAGDLTVNTDALFVDASAKKVGIGTTSPGSLLDVSATGASDEPTIRVISENGKIFLRTAGSSGSFPSGAGGNDGELVYLGGDLYIGCGDASRNLIFYNGGSYNERMRINSGGQLLINTTSNGSDAEPALVVSGRANNATNSGMIRILRGENAASMSAGDNLGDLTFGSVDGARSAMIQAKAGTGWGGTTDCPGVLVFATAADGGGNAPLERMRIDSSGTATFAGVIKADAGIDFSAAGPSATQNAMGTTTSEILDHYEEGTWTPVVGGTATYTHQVGKYIKIGGTVHIKCDLSINTLGTGSLGTIDGLPFNVSGAGEGYGSTNYCSNLSQSFGSLNCYAANGTDNIYFSLWNVAGNSCSINPAIFQNSSRVQVSITYFTH